MVDFDLLLIFTKPQAKGRKKA